MSIDPTRPTGRAGSIEDPFTPLRRQLTGRAARLYDHLATEYPGYMRRSVRMPQADCLDYPFRTLLRSAYVGKIRMGLCRRNWTDDHVLWLIAEHPEIILHAEELLEKQARKYVRNWWGGHYDWVGFIPIFAIAAVLNYLLVSLVFFWWPFSLLLNP